MKREKYHIVATVTKSNRKIVETELKSTLLTHIYINDFPALVQGLYIYINDVPALVQGLYIYINDFRALVQGLYIYINDFPVLVQGLC